MLLIGFRWINLHCLRSGPAALCFPTDVPVRIPSFRQPLPLLLLFDRSLELPDSFTQVLVGESPYLQTRPL